MNIKTILGQKTAYKDQYDNSLLQPISRLLARDNIKIPAPLPFSGYDIWNCYEVSWLNLKGKPEVKILELIVNAESENIIESKSLKLYLNSFNNTKFASSAEVLELIQKDLTLVVNSQVTVIINDLESYEGKLLSSFKGINLDKIDIFIDNFTIAENLPKLSDENIQVEETLYSNLLKSNCLVTNQPDWASIQISYKGLKIQPDSLLKYLISFRNHNEFHEQCVEQIFWDISKLCEPKELVVYARYTRRGGIDINPVRASYVLNIAEIENLRHIRQ